MCPISNGFRDKNNGLYSSLDLAPNIVLSSRRTAPLYEECESVWSVSWPSWLLIVDCKSVVQNTAFLHKCRICWCCTFTASAIIVPLLLLKNTIDGFLCAEFWIVDCSPRCSIHCMNLVHFPLLMLHLNGHVNKCRNRKTFLKWYSVALLLAREDFQHVSVFREQVWPTLHEDSLYPLNPQRVQNLHLGDSAMPLEFYHWLHTNRQLLPLIVFTDEATFIRSGNNTCNSHRWSHDNPNCTADTNFKRRFSINLWCHMIDDMLTGPVILDDRMTGQNYLRLSARWLTRTTGFSFGYAECYVLSAWRSPFSLYPTCDATSQWHFP